jgi:hypothetical protein
MHAGDEEPVVRHYLQANRLSTPLGFRQFRKQPEARFAQPTQANAAGEPDQKKPEGAEG